MCGISTMVDHKYKHTIIQMLEVLLLRLDRDVYSSKVHLIVDRLLGAIQRASHLAFLSINSERLLQTDIGNSYKNH